MRKLPILFLFSILSFALARGQATIGGSAAIGGTAVLDPLCTPNCAIGPLVQSGTNSRYWIVKGTTGPAIIFRGDYSWNLLMPYGENGAPQTVSFANFVTFAKSHNINMVTLWRKDTPVLYGWQLGVNWTIGNWPWNRPGPGTASDGNPEWDLTSYNSTFFSTLRTDCLLLYQNGIYCNILLFDMSDNTFTRGSADGGPFTSGNNINSVADGYLNSGSVGTGMSTMTTNNAVSNAEDAFVKHLIDNINDLPNVTYELAEEQPGTSFNGSPGYGGASTMTFWAPHMLGLIHAYEGGGTWESTTYPAKALQHPVGIGSMNVNDVSDSTLYSSTLDWIEPTINSTFSNQFPANVATNNQSKVVVNDSDHSQDAATLLNSNGTVNDPQDREYIWENITSGAAGVYFLDPYLVSLSTTSPVRNTCGGTITDGICTTVDTKWDNFRNALGYVGNVTSLLDFQLITPQTSKCSTTFCLTNNAASGYKGVFYQTVGGGAFTVDLSAVSSGTTVTSKWMRTTTGVVTTGTSVMGGSATQSFTPPWTNGSGCTTNTDCDAVLILTGP
jgi:hypothetical protein